MTDSYHQSQSHEESTAQPATQPVAKFTNAQYRDKCFSITGTNSLHRLKEWCERHEISQSTWANLTVNIITRIIGRNDNFKKQVFCCVQEEINERAQASERICDLLGINVISLAELYEPLTPPSGSGSHTLKFDNEVYQCESAQDIDMQDVIYQYGTAEYHTSKTPRDGCADPYSAALTLLSPVDLAHGRKLIAKSKALSALMPDYM